jgi:methyltransferase
VTLSIIVLALVSAQRLGELVLANRNTRRLLAQGAKEYGARHYPLIVAMHAAWLIGLWVFGWNRPIDLFWLVVFVVLQALRVWVISTLGGRWTTRIIVPPDAPRIRKGPFRFIPHPNYAVVSAEIAVLPLAFGLPIFAAVFFILNALMLTVRIRAESRALSGAGEP